MTRRPVVAVWHWWPVFVARCQVRSLWEGLPGPWPVKAALCVACLAIPGPQDELLLLAVTAAFRVWRGRGAGATRGRPCT